MSSKPKISKRKFEAITDSSDPEDFNTITAKIDISNESDEPPKKRLRVVARLKRLGSLQGRLQALKSGDAYFKALGLTPRGALTNVGQAITFYNQQDIQIEGEINLLAAFASTTMTVSTGARCGDGNCYIQFVNMGQGDCTLVSSPKGTRFLIDLGSDATQDIFDPSAPTKSVNAQTFITSTIKSATFLNGAKQIHFVLLTHSDTDHYDKFSWLRSTKLTASVGRVYYSNDGIARYSSGKASQKIREAVSANNNAIRCATITRTSLDNQLTSLRPEGSTTPLTLNTTVKYGEPTAFVDKEYIDPTTNAIVIYNEKDTNFKVSILAGNVEGATVKISGTPTYVTSDANIKLATQDAGMKLDGTDINRKSLVILVEFNGKKVLITGDATAVTENFLVNQYKDNALQNINVLRIGHHGSPTSSSYRFISTIGAVDRVICSTPGATTVKHKLPKWSILQLCNTKKTDDTAHTVYAWSITSTSDGGTRSANSTTKYLYTTGSNGTSTYTIPKP